MSASLRQKIIRTRKPHKCSSCKKAFEPGHEMCRIMPPGRNAIAQHWCLDCWKGTAVNMEKCWRLQQINSVHTLLVAYENALTECDGHTYLCNTILLRFGIVGNVYLGQLIWKGVSQIDTHLWLDLPNGLRVDYRAQMWFTEFERYQQAVPHGVFYPADFPEVEYRGKIFIDAQHPLSDKAVHALTAKNERFTLTRSEEHFEEGAIAKP